MYKSSTKMRLISIETIIDHCAVPFWFPKGVPFHTRIWTAKTYGKYVVQFFSPFKLVLVIALASTAPDIPMCPFLEAGHDLFDTSARVLPIVSIIIEKFKVSQPIIIILVISASPIITSGISLDRKYGHGRRDL